MKDPKGPFLFNLKDDPTESNDLSKTEKSRFTEMQTAMNDFFDSID